MPGRRVVILGSGDIGLIMARRMTLEGAKVLLVAELMPYSGGLKRNIVQCLDDFGIPLKLSHTVVDIQGKDRVTGVTVAQVGADRKPIPGTETHYDCDTLLLSCGLIPENELSRSAGIELHPVTGGPSVNDALETSIPGIFACGNVLHVHDLVDYVSQEAANAGRQAAAYIKRQNTSVATPDLTPLPSETQAACSENVRTLPILCEGGVRYTVPETLRPDAMDDTVTPPLPGGQHLQKPVHLRLLRRQADSAAETSGIGPRRNGTGYTDKKTAAEYPDIDHITVTIEEG